MGRLVVLGGFTDSVRQDPPAKIDLVPHITPLEVGNRLNKYNAMVNHYPTALFNVPVKLYLALYPPGAIVPVAGADVIAQATAMNSVDFPQPDPSLADQPETSFVVEVDTTAFFANTSLLSIDGINVVPVVEYTV